MSHNVTAGEFERELLDLVTMLKDKTPKRAEFTYDNVPSRIIRVLAQKYNSTLHTPDEVVKCWWTFIRMGPVTFKLNGEIHE